MVLIISNDNDDNMATITPNVIADQNQTTQWMASVYHSV